MGEEIANDMPDKETISTIYKELLLLKTKTKQSN